MRFLNNIPYSLLLVAAILLGLAPFVPEPHVLEKMRMLMNGNLTRPVDIFDLLFHLLPLVLLVLRFMSEKSSKK